MSINLTNAIYTLLAGNSGLTAIIGNKIYPLIIPQNVEMPAVVIEKYFVTNYTNDYNAPNDSTVEITVLASTYNLSVQIATLINNILCNYTGTQAGINILDCRLVSCDEGYQEEAFLQKLVYVMKNY
jgi:hypothetical protein